MVVTCGQMQAAEAELFATGVQAEPLMKAAGLRCARAIRRWIPEVAAAGGGRAELYLGKGNNAGDALVVGRWLRCWGWSVEAHFSVGRGEMGPLAQKKLAEFEATPQSEVSGGPLLLIDGLLGIGARGPLRGEIGVAAARLNRQRVERWATTVALDLPSGIDGDTGEPYAGAVVADHTLSICVPKRGILADQAIDHVGRIHHIPLDEIPVHDADREVVLLHPESLRPLLQRRVFDTHKGQAGRVSLVAGSEGLLGAAVLSAMGAIHAGAGLTTLWVPEAVYPLVVVQAPPEVMVRSYSSFSEVMTVPADVYAVGPGLGEDANVELLDWLTTHEGPVVVDADALNWLASDPKRLVELGKYPRVLTPHPGELRRLISQESFDIDSGRIDQARAIADKWGVTLLHKGARSVVATAGQPVWVNTTGTPAMASGGMGDVLTGVIAALVGQGQTLHDATGIGTWALGRAAEVSPDAKLASKVASQIGPALRELTEEWV